MLVSLSNGLFLSPKVTTAEEKDTFVPKRMDDGRPIFDGNKTHLTPFVNFIMDNDMNMDDLIALSDPRQPAYDSNNQPIQTIKISAGYELPLFLDGTDNVQGFYTDFPSFIGMGSSWNKELIDQIGTVIGNEKRGSVAIDDSSKALMWSAIGDIRNNPLSGRFDEGLSEDPFMTSTLSTTMGSAISGVNLKDQSSDNDFYLKTGLQSKHFAVYNGQWFRHTNSNNVSARTLHEYQLPAFIKQVEEGSVIGFMTSYGRTNGIPNSISPNIRIAQDAADYSLLLFTDFNAPIQFPKAFGNGFDAAYIPDNEHLSALFTNIGSGKGQSSYNGALGNATKAQTSDGIKRGLFGVDIKAVKEAVRPTLELWVRLGYFNEREENGLPKGYPYNDLIQDPVNADTKENQQVALQAARESIVLLKNNGILPLEKDKNVAVFGQYADYRNKTLYSVGKTPTLPGSNLTISNGIKELIGEERVTVNSGGKVVGLKSVQNDNFLTVDLETTKGVLKADKEPISNSDDTDLYKISNDSYISKNEAFEIYDWGQDAYSFKSLANNNFLIRNTSNGLIEVDGGRPSTLLPFNRNVNAIFSYENIKDDKSIRQGGFIGSFAGGFETGFLNLGNYLTVSEAGVKANTNVRSFKSLTDKSSVTFEEVIVKEPGSDAAELAESNDYGIIAVGAPAQINVSEGVDRARLDMGDDQYALAANTAAAFKAQGKQTIVIVNSSYPVAMEKLENDENIDAILFAPYGGQYDGTAIAEVLFGDVAPTGRLQSTWYKDISSFPELTEYNVPEGNPTIQSMAELDPRFTVDMENADHAEAKLTYLYSDAETTYPFGYGLGYTTFQYSNLQVPKAFNGNKSFKVTVDVTNTGTVDSQEVVQLYVSNLNSSYGDNVPKKQLAAFTKQFIPAGKTQKVTLNVDPQDFAIWDVNRGEHVVESGKYDLSIRTSSSDEDTQLSSTIDINGKKLATLNLASPVNVWDHAFENNKLVYREISKERTTTYSGQYYAVMSTGPESWVGIPNVKVNNAKEVALRVASKNPESTIEVRKDSPSGEVLATLSFKETGSSSYKVPSVDDSGATLHEMGYAEVSSKLPGKLKGTTNLYLVFKDKDIRVDTIQFR